MYQSGQEEFDTENSTTVSTDNAEHVVMGLIGSDRLFLLAFCIVSLVLLGLHFRTKNASGFETIEIRNRQQEQYIFQLEINSATWVEWMQLEGIGETTARKIVADRESNGPFQSIADVRRVKGIGPKTLDKIQPHLFCLECE